METRSLQQQFDLGLQHHQAGRLADAEAIYRRILAGHPRHPGALHYLGLLAAQLGHTDAAVQLIRQAIAEHPNYADAYSNLGNVLSDAGRLDEAIASYQQAIVLAPMSQSFNNLGNALRAKGRIPEAVAACRRAVELAPLDAGCLVSLGNALCNNSKAKDAVSCFRKAILLKPGYAEAYSNLGGALSTLGELDEAVAACRKSIGLKSDSYQAYHNLGDALRSMGEVGEAITAWRKALALKPGEHRIHSIIVFNLHYLPEYDARSILSEAHHWAELHEQPLLCGAQPHSNDPSPQRRLRIGYVSPDFRDHAVGRNLVGLFRQHDHDRFHITCYSHVQQPDFLTSLFQEKSDSWRNIIGLSDPQLAAKIREDSIDVLVDLTLHTWNNRLRVFAVKPAPVQVTFAGYPGTTGLSSINYRLSDPHLDPPGMDESVYSEKTIRLPSSFWCFDVYDGQEIQVNPLPALENRYVTFGCLNAFAKVNDPTLLTWARVLAQVPNSRLLLLADPGKYLERRRDLFRNHGVEPERIEFLPRLSREKYLRSYHRIDLALDTFPYNGHTTSLDALWMGVPVVTQIGQTVASRAGWSQLSNLGLTELAGKTADQFVQIAVDLANDLEKLKELRTTLRRRMEQSPLMNAPAFAHGIEEAYRHMWRQWCATR